MGLDTKKIALWMASFPADQERALTALLTDPSIGGETGAGVALSGSVATYADLPSSLGSSDAGKAYLVQADKLVYVWSGTAFPASGSGVPVQGPPGANGSSGVSVKYIDTVNTYADLPTGLGSSDASSGWVVAADGLLYVWNGSTFPISGAGAPFQGPSGTNGQDGAAGAPADGMVPFNEQTVASYTAQASDVGTSIEMNYASANTVVINPGVFSANQLVPVRCAGAGTTTIAPAAGMNIYTAGLLSLTQYQLGLLHFKDGSTAYFDAPNATTATPAIAITTSFPAPVVGTAYAGYVHGTNTGGATGTMAYTVNALPAGLSLNASTGDITGTPTTAGTVAATFGVTNGTQSQAPTHSFVTTAAPVMTLTGTLPGGTVGAAYSADLTLGGTYTTPVTIDFSSGSKPAWMTVTVGTGKVTFSGTPTTAETETFTPRATDSSGTPQTATDAQSITIAAAASGPAFVQGVSTSTATSTSAPSALFAGATTSGNRLVASLQCPTGAEPTATPAGWTAVTGGYVTRQNQKEYVYSKQSDGTESGIAFALASTGISTVTISEWNNAKLGTVTSGFVDTLTNSAATSTGTTDAPVSALAIPLMLIGFHFNPGTLSGYSPWTTINANDANTTHNELAAFAYRAAPNAAVSWSATKSLTQSTAGCTTWVNVWLEPNA